MRKATTGPVSHRLIYDTTNLEGRITVTLTPGTWYVNGYGSKVAWVDIPVEVTTGMDPIVFSPDNANQRW